jgi:protein TonB
MEGLGGAGAIGGLFGAGAPASGGLKKVNISAGVAAGMITKKVVPVYPAVAKAARIQGVVVLQSTITKTGEVDQLRVVGGPPLLQGAALDAVKQWRYKPYVLNGEPVEVETTVNVIFSLGEPPAAAAPAPVAPVPAKTEP